jgi:Transposase
MQQGSICRNDRLIFRNVDPHETSRKRSRYGAFSNRGQHPGTRGQLGAEEGVSIARNLQLDVSFNEDSSRKRAGYAAQNFSMINRIALNLIKKENSKKRSVKGKRLDAGWNNQYLLKILSN